jgi:hypothetical protein
MRLAVVALAAVLSCAGQTVTPAQQPLTPEQQREDLLERIEELQRRLPKELRRTLSMIAMKFATGHCSPYRVLAFEKQLEALDEGKQRKFAKEWEHLQLHPLWPSEEEVRALEEEASQ